MVKLHRRHFLEAAVGASALAVPSLHLARAQSAEFVLKFGNNNPESHPMIVAMVKAAERIKQESGGRVELQLFPNSSLGTDTDMLSQVRSGALELFALSGLVLSTLAPVAAIHGIGFAWQNYEQIWDAMDGDLGSHVREGISKLNLFAFENMWDNGFRQITSSSHPIEKVEDLSGFKIRVPPSPLWVSMFTAFGASPTSINLAETYSALQTKIVEGHENPIALILILRMYEVQKYVSITNHMWDGYWLVANGRLWSRVPDGLKDIIARNIKQATMEERVAIRGLNDSVKDDLIAKGLVFNTPPSKPFRDKLTSAGFYEQWRGKFGEQTWSLLERHTGKLS
ncbi:MAG: TRAP transporter substrate-binding protein [Bradyrhizobiaceae bacterium]|nr:MAG: TRAP transporter substrate-binding protein [Bradyrhizobiaceae bacterium]